MFVILNTFLFFIFPCYSLVIHTVFLFITNIHSLSFWGQACSVKYTCRCMYANRGKFVEPVFLDTRQASLRIFSLEISGETWVSFSSSASGRLLMCGWIRCRLEGSGERGMEERVEEWGVGEGERNGEERERGKE